MSTTANNIVVACESENAPGLIETVFSAMDERLVLKIDQRKQNIGQRFFKDAKVISLAEENDPYDKQDGKMQEAVDHVVEMVLEDRAELDSSIKEASTKYEVSEEKLKEYFNAFFENVRGDSVKSDDRTPNQDAMNDEDADRRIRFECMEPTLKKDGLKESTYQLTDGTTVAVNAKTAQAITNVSKQLSESNQTKFIGIVSANRAGFDKMASFCIQQMANS